MEYKDILPEWDYDKNIGLDPGDYSRGSIKKIWWKCSLGHSYQASINNRINGNGKGSGCPYCVGKKVLAGFNDLATKRPELLPEWDYEKNIDISPQKVTQNSNKKIWWKCIPYGHEWLAKISDRTKPQATGCPYCSGSKLLKGFNDLASCYPEIAKYWDSKKNDKAADEVNKGSSKKAWWTCEMGHSYQQKIIGRVKIKRVPACPICRG